MPRSVTVWAPLNRYVLHTTPKKSLPLNKICAFNKQIILIVNLLPKQLVINYNLMINYLVLTAWGNAAIKH